MSAREPAVLRRAPVSDLTRYELALDSVRLLAELHETERLRGSGWRTRADRLRARLEEIHDATK